MKQHPKYKNYTIYEDGRVFNTLSGKFLKPLIHVNTGYVSVVVREEVGSKWKWEKVHRLVAQTYLPNYENKREVNHIDCNIKNNNLSNLEWNTSKENKKHAWENELYSCHSEGAYNAILTNEQVHSICQDIQDGLTNKSISKKYAVDVGRISDIRTGRRWTRISSNYNMKVDRKLRMSEETIRKVCEKIVLGFTDREISERLSISISQINRIRRGAIHKDIVRDYIFTS